MTHEEFTRRQAEWAATERAAAAEREAAIRAEYEGRLAPIEAERAAAAEAQRQAEEAAAAAERARQEAEETSVQRLERQQQEQAAELARLREERAQSDALLLREQERGRVQLYREQQLAANTETIHPSLHDMVQGFTNAEIDAAIQRAQVASQRILDEVAAQQQGQTAAQQLYARQQPGVGVTAPPAGPIESIGVMQPMTAADIDALKPHEYEAMRPQLLAAASAAYRGQPQSQ